MNDQKPTENGWTRRIIANEPRLSEAVLAYQEAGFETRLEPLTKAACRAHDDNEEVRECRICFDGHEDEYRIIYTRPKPEGSES